MAKGIHDGRYRALIDRLASARKQQGLSQATLAERLGQPQQFVSRYELGERRLDIIEFIDVAAALGLDGQAVLADIVRDVQR